LADTDTYLGKRKGKVKIPNFLSGRRKGPRASTNTTSMYEKVQLM
jgi:hypothetical protein